MGNIDKLVNETLLFIAQKGWTSKGNDFFDTLSLFLADKLNVTYVIIDKLNSDNKTAETLSFVANGAVNKNVSYPLVNTPCENVMGKNLCCYVKNIQNLFPDDTMLVDMKAESYIGIPLWDTKGAPIGLIALLDTKQIDNSAEIQTILQIVAVRVAHEIERNNYEQELIDKNKKLEQANYLKTAFLQNMSHEIRTPMNAILGFSELLPSNFDNKVKLTSHAQIINQRCTDLLDIINDILDIAKIESGQLPVNIENCNIAILFAELKVYFTELKLRYGKQDIVLQMTCSPEIESNFILTDKVKLRQILINLISNAFKFTEQGSIEVGCKLISNHEIEFYVSDTGIGIPEDKHQLVFERFAQVETKVSRQFGGTGLGLSIVKGLVNLLGGKVWLQSEFGKGSTFFFTINKNDNPTHTPVKVEISKSGEFNNNQNKTVLIVEDDSSNTALIKEILSQFNFKMLFAINGVEAITMAQQYNPDLILLDIGLPDMIGYDAIRQILNQQPSMKIIAQTAFASDNDRLEALKYGCIDYISKPLNVQRLQSLVEKNL